MIGYFIKLYRKLPGHPLKGTLSKAFLAYRRLRSGRKVIKTIDGITYELDLDEVIDSWIYYEGHFEIDTTNALRKLCRPGMTVVDIGANIGCHTLLLAKNIGDGRVVAFEPMPWARRKLERNCKLSGIGNVTVEGCVLSDHNRDLETFQFRSSWLVSGGTNPESSGPVSIAITTLDTYFQKNPTSALGLIKIDVDGHECKVIRGALATLRQFHPALILELGSEALAAAGDSLGELLDLLEMLDYRIYTEDTFELFPDREAVVASVPPNSTINVICANSGTSLA